MLFFLLQTTNALAVLVSLSLLYFRLIFWYVIIGKKIFIDENAFDSVSLFHSVLRHNKQAYSAYNSAIGRPMSTKKNVWKFVEKSNGWIQWPSRIYAIFKIVLCVSFVSSSFGLWDLMFVHGHQF